MGHAGRHPVASPRNVNRREVQTGHGHEMGRDGFIAGREGHQPVPGDHPAVDLHQVAQDFPGRKDEIHPAVEHGPSVADVGPVKSGRLSPLLVNSDGGFPGQAVEMDAAGVAVAPRILHQDLRLFQVRFVPIHAAAQGVELQPITPDLTALWFHGFPPQAGGKAGGRGFKNLSLCPPAPPSRRFLLLFGRPAGRPPSRRPSHIRKNKTGRFSSRKMTGRRRLTAIDRSVFSLY